MSLLQFLCLNKVAVSTRHGAETEVKARAELLCMFVQET